MKPMHATVTRISRCPGCHSKYTCQPRKKSGKTAARFKAKREVSREMQS